MDEKELGRRLQAARQKAKLTQQELCNQTGLSYSTLAKIERGAIKSPSVFTVASIAKVVGASLEELVGEIKPSVQAAKSAKQSKSGVRFVYFDINGVLVRFFHRAFTRIAEDTGASADLIETTFWHYNDAVCRGEITIEEFNEHMTRQLHIGSLDWAKYYFEAIDPIEEMHEVVRWAAEHYKIGLLSNIMPGFVEELMQRKLIPALRYDAIVDSSSAKAVKPEPQIYQIAQGKAGVEGFEILLIDDSRSNLVAAEREGWHVLWFDDYQPAEGAARVKAALEF